MANVTTLYNLYSECVAIDSLKDKRIASLEHSIHIYDTVVSKQDTIIARDARILAQSNAYANEQRSKKKIWRKVGIGAVAVALAELYVLLRW